MHTVLNLQHPPVSGLTYLAPNPCLSQLRKDVASFLGEAPHQEGQPEAVLLATKLAAANYRVLVRTTTGGGLACFRQLRHKALIVQGAGDCTGTDFIVDPSFRCQFEIAHPTSEYRSVLDALPLFVGTPAQLVPIVGALCAEMAFSFQSRGMAVPPWRRKDSVLSKWHSSSVSDVAIDGSCCARPVSISNEDFVKVQI
ncbi:MAG: hypothetical protein WDW36_009236 [Sanguina aurantia]